MSNRSVNRFVLFVVYCLSSIFLVTCGTSTHALDRVLDTGVLRIGMDASFPPFEYVDGEGNLVGFDVGLAREVAARLGVEARFIANLSYDGLYDALTAERVDAVISALYVDPSRTDAFAYSTPYFDAGQVLVMPGGAGGIGGVSDLARRTLAVEFGSEGDVVARTWSRRLVGLKVLPCQSADEALAMVAAGGADAALVDRLSALAGVGGGSGLLIVGQPVTNEPYAVAVRREERGLLRAINRALAELEADGTLARLRERWFASTP